MAGQMHIPRVYRDDFCVGRLMNSARNTASFVLPEPVGGHQQNSIRQTDDALEGRLVVAQESELRQTEPETFLSKIRITIAFAVFVAGTKRASQISLFQSLTGCDRPAGCDARKKSPCLPEF